MSVLYTHMDVSGCYYPQGRERASDWEAYEKQPMPIGHYRHDWTRLE